MKKLFMKKAPKEATPEENKAYLDSINVPTQKGSRERKFDGFSQYAREVAARGKKDYSTRDAAVADPNALQSQQEAQIYGTGGNPYARQREQRQYDQAVATGTGGAGESSNPYASNAFLQGGPGGGNPYANQNSGSSQGGGGPSQSNPYASQAAGRYNDDAASIAPSVATAAPSGARDELFGRRGDTQYRKKEFDFGPDSRLDELNDIPESNALDELNEVPDSSNPHASSTNAYGQPQNPEDEEDEEVNDLKRQIRFTKKESLSSTQNALRLAAEAEASGRNALGMLGAQGERIANTERSLALAKNQSKIATEKSSELERLNRSIFVPNVSNPFTSKRRLHEKEARIKSEYLQEQVAREHRRQQAFESERRVLDGLNANGVSYSETALKHKKEQMRNSDGRKKFQFEADSEDEEIEDELELNLEGISNAAGRMKNLALGMGEEVESQNRRLERVTRQTDELDVDVHLNAARLAAIK